MKKRDYYILGLLTCMVIYSALNRKTVLSDSEINSIGIQEPHDEMLIHPMQRDSAHHTTNQIIEAEV
ncbi:hypothetical protein [Sunxiuqinia sp. sy24]|uniref:hypothetical protein n=1 Tax=Sunxiuqinia sp. sy24 TaxID=3461495 RepID=UPI00404554A1